MNAQQEKAWKGLVAAKKALSDPEAGESTGGAMVAAANLADAEDACREVGFTPSQIRLIEEKPDTFIPTF
jgi:hypothetical protein